VADETKPLVRSDTPGWRSVHGLRLVALLSLPSYAFVLGGLLGSRLGEGPDTGTAWVFLGAGGLVTGIASPILWVISCLVAVWSTFWERTSVVRKGATWIMVLLSAWANLHIIAVFRRCC
jgi:hypothetical protein